MKISILLYNQDHPFAQGVFTAILISILLFIVKLINKGISKAGDSFVVNTGNLDSILQIALKKYKSGNIGDSINLYKKAIEIDAFNITALISLGNIYIENKEYYTAERYLQILYDEYKDKINSGDRNIINNRNKICISTYKLGYLLNQRGELDKAKKIKQFSFSNSKIESENLSLLTKFNY